MTREKHIQKHRLLHRKLNELLGDFLYHSDMEVIDTTLEDFIKWSHEQTTNPTEEG